MGDKAAGEMEWRRIATPHKDFFPSATIFSRSVSFFYPFTWITPAARQ